MTLRNRKKIEKRDEKRAKFTKARSIDNKLNHNHQEAVTTNGVKLAFEPLTTEKNIILEDSGSESLIISASTRKLINEPATKPAASKLDEKAQSIIDKYERQKQALVHQKPPPTLIEFENPNFNKNIDNNNEIDSGNIKPANKEPKIPSLFHPSKINMASTPIKTNGFERKFVFNYKILELKFLF